jgi:hypothetical protein
MFGYITLERLSAERIRRAKTTPELQAVPRCDSGDETSVNASHDYLICRTRYDWSSTKKGTFTTGLIAIATGPSRLALSAGRLSPL